MPLEITIPMPGLSLNHSHISLRRGGRIKTNLTRDYEQEFCQHLMEYSAEISEFLKTFDPRTQAIYADYKFYIPVEKFYTKKGLLNLKGDTDNLIKVTQDNIFSRIINDGHVVAFSAARLPTRKDAHIVVEIDTIPIPEVDDV